MPCLQEAPGAIVSTHFPEAVPCALHTCGSVQKSAQNINFQGFIFYILVYEENTVKPEKWLYMIHPARQALAFTEAEQEVIAQTTI